jgi:hypothetical protein
MGNKNRVFWLTVIAVLLFAVFVIILFFNPFGQKIEIEGKNQDFSSFYYAEDGIWILLDPVTYVLKEQKYVSSDSERDAYTVREVHSGGKVKIIQSEGRWKKVEVLENGKSSAEGWIDAHFVKKAEKQTEENEF